MQHAIIARSIKTLKKKIGIVILVGIADRLLTTVIAMEAIAKGQNIKRLPEKIIASMVMIVTMHP